MKKFLTDVMLRRLRPPRSGRLEIGDKGPKGIDGLVIRVTPRGAVSFSVVYKVPGEGGVSPTGRLLTGRQHRITLGRYPALGLSEARKKAQEILRTVGEGCDPRPERRELFMSRLSSPAA